MQDQERAKRMLPPPITFPGVPASGERTQH